MSGWTGWHGPQKRGAMRDRREQKRKQAEGRRRRAQSRRDREAGAS